MDPKLKAILKKLSQAGATGALDDAERAYLDELVDDGDGRRRDGPVPLWSLVRRRALLFHGVFPSQLDMSVDPILIAAGAPPDSLRGYAYEPRKLALVTREGLERAVRRHLTHNDTNLRAHATRLVGMAALDEVLDVIVDSLESGREERTDWGMPVIAAALETLTLARHPKTRTYAMKYVARDDWSLRTAAQAAVLAAPGQPSREELERIFEMQFDPNLLVALPDVFVRAAVDGALRPEHFDDMLDRLPLYYVTTAQIAADMIVSARWEDRLQSILRTGSHLHPMRAALAARLAWTDEAWALPALRACLEEEHDPDTRMCLVTAISTIGERDDAAIASRLGSADPSEIMGGIWATVRSGMHVDALRGLCREMNPQVRRAAMSALVVNGPDVDRDRLELAWTDLVHNEDAWWPWGLPVQALLAHDIELPACAKVFRHVSRDVGRFTSDEALDEALALCREHPLQLMRWLRSDVPADQRVRAIELAGLAGGFDDALESALLTSLAPHVASAAALELLSGEGPTSELTTLAARLALLESAQPSDTPLAPLVLSASSEWPWRQRAVQSLATLGPDAEPYLAMFTESQMPDVARAAAEVVAARPERARRPFLRDVARLVNGEARQLRDLDGVERLVVSLSPRVRIALAELGALPEHDPGQILRLFPFLLVDRDEEVAAAALGALATHGAELPWVRELVLAQTWSPYWRTRETAIAAMAQLAATEFVPRLLELAGEDDSSARDSAIRGLERIAETKPELGLVVLDIRQPERIATRFGVNAQIDYMADRSTEALRMLLLGLDKRRDAELAKKHAGRKVMITPAGEDDGGAGAWTSSQFDALAMYLRVVYTDDESGAIVAEIGEDSSGEVLNALLQNTTVAVRRVAWT
jgi:hypothetical protein